MSITSAAIRNDRVTFVVLLVIAVAGYSAYVDMPRAEDPGFIIRTAQVMTFFPGASPERVEPEQSNLAAMLGDFWYNPMWRHGEVAWAIFETILMAFLGTFGAALVALPLAFMAAHNFTPLRSLRFALRRIFDFLRGVDGLIWTIVLARAFGPGPLTGGLATAASEDPPSRIGWVLLLPRPCVARRRAAAAGAPGLRLVRARPRPIIRVPAGAEHLTGAFEVPSLAIIAGIVPLFLTL